MFTYNLILSVISYIHARATHNKMGGRNLITSMAAAGGVCVEGTLPGGRKLKKSYLKNKDLETL